MTKNEINILLAQSEMQEHKTSHVLHFLLSIITAGIWIIPWIMIASNNSFKRNDALRTIKNGGVKSWGISLSLVFAIIALVIILLQFYKMGLI